MQKLSSRRSPASDYKAAHRTPGAGPRAPSTTATRTSSPDRDRPAGGRSLTDQRAPRPPCTCCAVGIRLSRTRRRGRGVWGDASSIATPPAQPRGARARTVLLTVAKIDAPARSSNALSPAVKQAVPAGRRARSAPCPMGIDREDRIGAARTGTVARSNRPYSARIESRVLQVVQTIKAVRVARIHQVALDRLWPQRGFSRPLAGRGPDRRAVGVQPRRSCWAGPNGDDEVDLP